MTSRRRRLIGGAKSYRPWKEWSIGEQIIGKYTAIGEDNYGKPNYTIQIESMNFDHEPESGMKAEEGKLIGLNSAGSLDSKMADIEIGTICEFTYQGTTKLPANHKFKDKDCHQIDVAVLEDEDGDSEPDANDLSDL